MERNFTGTMTLTIGEMLMVIRKRRGLSQKALAELTFAGLPVSTIAAIEADEWESVRLSALVDAFMAVDHGLHVVMRALEPEEEE